MTLIRHVRCIRLRDRICLQFLFTAARIHYVKQTVLSMLDIKTIVIIGWPKKT